MKKYLVIVLILLSSTLFPEAKGQTPPPPPPPPNGGTTNGHGLGGNQGTQSAPIGSGLEILLIIGALYSGKKVYDQKKSKE